MNRLSPLDASFLHIEDDRNHMHIGSVAILEGPSPDFADVVGMVEGKLRLVPRYRQRVRLVRFDTAPDVDVLCRGIEEGIRELGKEARTGV